MTQGTGCAAYKDKCETKYSVNDILMKHCGTFYVYFLKPVLEYDIHIAYCMGWYIDIVLFGILCMPYIFCMGLYINIKCVS